MHELTQKQIAGYLGYLRQEERSEATVEKYHRDLTVFFQFLPAGKRVNKELVIDYKEQLVAHYAPASVNSMLAAVNGLFGWLGWTDCRIKALKLQRQIFCAADTELTRAEYIRLLSAAKARRNQRLYLLLQTVCATGIRVSELRHITAEGVRRGRVEVRCKGKSRTVFLPKKLQQELKRYCKSRSLTAGPVFVTRSGRPLDRSNIWKEMKDLCQQARVLPSKVFPHNLRHLFARTYYSIEKDLSRLADLLGHSSIDTTRIYTATSGAEHARKINLLGLVI